MARVGVTYDQVVAVADGLVAAGEAPTIKRVRAALGDTGSPNTLHRHLVAWRAAKPVVQRKAPELPSELQAALAREIERQAAAARAEIEAALVEAQAEAGTLAEAGEVVEQERDALLVQVSALTTEKEQAVAAAAERAAEIGRKDAELAREREAAERARIDLAKLELKAEAQAEAAALQALEVERLRAQVQSESQGRVAAEQKAAVLDARLVAAGERVRVLEDAVAGLRDQLEVATRERDDARNSFVSTHEQTAVLSARLDAAIAQVERERQDVLAHREAADAARKEAQELRLRAFAQPN